MMYSDINNLLHIFPTLSLNLTVTANALLRGEQRNTDAAANHLNH
ncbi:hypothetical protein VCHENC02_4095 [Vibrio harveyi]|uniref:Uncharacterized protein n=1 Tax=Vibrio harveyi TaxID=669 RepID=A0A454CUS9_VIBHA|nr:hypothetical protein VCHENC02_4095 [Vibrio harveyi]